VPALVEVGGRVGEGVAGMPKARPHTARKVAVRRQFEEVAAGNVLLIVYSPETIN